MKNFNQDRRGGDRRFGGGSDFKKRSFGGGSSERYHAVCDKCGQDCEVPFKPSSGKPVFCDRCFKKGDRPEMDRGGRDRGRDGGRDFSRPRFDEKRMYAVVCDKCGKDCEVPFKPSSDKPVFCSTCFEQEGGGASSSPRKSNRQTEDGLELINKKLDRILETLISIFNEKTPKSVKIEKIEKDKEVKVKEEKKSKTEKKVKEVKKEVKKSAKKVLKKAGKK